ncbi:MAG: outer membrane beta-barrel protein [bacterium]
MIKGKKFGARAIMQWGVPGLLFLLSFFPVPESWAVGNIHFGLMEIHPGIQIKRTYRRLVDEDDSDSGDDWVTTYSPGLKVQWPIRQHALKCDWLLQYPRYDKHSNWNYDGQRLSTVGNFLFGLGGRQITLELGHLQVKTDEPADISESRRKFEQSRLSSKLGINLNNNLRLDFSYSQENYDYQNSDLDDQKIYQYAASVNVRIKPKTVAFISGIHTKHDYNDVVNDSGTWTIGPGLRWDATAKLSGQISGGYSWKDYETQDSLNTWVIKVDLTHRLTDHTNLSLGIDKGERDHSVLKRDENGNIKYDANGNMEEDFDNYAFQQVRISLDHQLTYKVKALSGFTYEYDKYHGIYRQDTVFSWRLGLRYQIQEWMVTDVEFEKRHRDSAGEGFYAASGYDNNIFSLSLGLAL